MAQPDFISDGTTPNPTDPRLRVWTKILGVEQNKAGALAANNPRNDDTFRVIREKLNCALNGTAYGT